MWLEWAASLSHYGPLPQADKVQQMLVVGHANWSEMRVGIGGISKSHSNIPALGECLRGYLPGKWLQTPPPNSLFPSTSAIQVSKRVQKEEVICQVWEVI